MSWRFFAFMKAFEEFYITEMEKKIWGKGVCIDYVSFLVAFWCLVLLRVSIENSFVIKSFFNSQSTINRGSPFGCT